ncbi:MAG TPA: PH domain-containing protein [Opitutus sp.]|nr:PH domain-containing protein [Opitutus sp.]
MSTTPEEIVIWRGSPSHWTNFGAYLFCTLVAGFILAAFVLTAAGPFVLGALVLPLGYILFRSVATRNCVCAVTTERVRCTTGRVSRHTAEIDLHRIRDCRVAGPVLLRLVGCGDLVITGVDADAPPLVLHAVPGVHRVKDLLRAHIDLQRQRREPLEPGILPP